MAHGGLPTVSRREKSEVQMRMEPSPRDSVRMGSGAKVESVGLNKRIKFSSLEIGGAGK